MRTDPKSRPALLSRRAGLCRLAAAATAPLLVGHPDVGAAYETAPDGEGDHAAGDCLFGVFPYLPPLSLDRVFAPIVGAFGRVLGQEVHLRTKPSFEAFVDALAAGAYDLALVHPFLYLTAASHGYVPLARVDEPLRMVFLARDDGEVRRIRDLAGKTLALPPVLSAVSEMAKDALSEAGLRAGVEVRLRHLESKMSCIQAVTLGTAAACGLPLFAPAQLQVETGRTFRVVHESAMPVSLAVVAHARLPESAREYLRDLLVGWSGSPDGRQILAAAGWPGFVPAHDGDYDPVRAAVARTRRVAQRP